MFYSFSWNIHNAKAAFPPRGANLNGRKSCNILYIMDSTSVPFVRIHKKQTRPDTGTCPQRASCPRRKGGNGKRAALRRPPQRVEKVPDVSLRGAQRCGNLIGKVPYSPENIQETKSFCGIATTPSGSCNDKL